MKTPPKSEPASGTSSIFKLDVNIMFCGDCGYVMCVCELRRHHESRCRHRRAHESQILVPCDLHKFTICPQCDACDCEGIHLNQKTALETAPANTEGTP